MLPRQKLSLNRVQLKFNPQDVFFAIIDFAREPQSWVGVGRSYQMVRAASILVQLDLSLVVFILF